MKIIKIFFLPVFILSCHLRESAKLICSSEEYDIARLSNSYIFDGHDEPEIKIILDKISDSEIKFTNATVDKLSDIKVEFSDQVEDETLKKNLDDKKTTDEEHVYDVCPAIDNYAWLLIEDGYIEGYNYGINTT